jgi:hypothetical protein
MKDSNTNPQNGQVSDLMKEAVYAKKQIERQVIGYENDPMTIERIVQGARLIEAGLVYRGWVRDEEPNRYYKVNFAGIPASYTCTCPDFQSGQAPRSRLFGGPMCSHTWAAHLAWIGGEELSPPPIPFMGEPVVFDQAGIYDEIDF